MCVSHPCKPSHPHRGWAEIAKPKQELIREVPTVPSEQLVGFPNPLVTKLVDHLPPPETTPRI